MLLTRVEQSDWLSNAYLVFDEPGGKGVLVDSNTVTDPLAELAEREGVEITHLLLTHHHYDHVVGARKLADRFGVPIFAHELTDELIDEKVDQTFADGDVIETGSLRIEVTHTPGHCADHCALGFNGTDVLTADVLFKGTVGGTRAPGATGFADLKSSVMDKLMKLPPETRVHPGHREPTTIGAEWDSNPFIRIWRGLDDRAPRSARSAPPTPTSASRRPWSCGRPTTTAATRRGSGSPTAPTRSSAARRSSATRPRLEPRTRPRLHVAGFEPVAAVRAVEVVGDLAAAADVLEDARRARRRQIAVTPAHQRGDHREQVEPHPRREILESLGPGPVAPPLEDPVPRQVIQASRQDAARDSEAALKALESRHVTTTGVAHDQQRPALADKLERAGDRAVLTVVGARQHSPIVARV